MNKRCAKYIHFSLNANFAFSGFFLYNRDMKVLFSIFFFLFPFSLFAADGFIGENPGLDFYTTIDESSDSLHTQIVNKHLNDTPSLDTFAAWCPGAWVLAGGATTPQILSDIANGRYTTLISIINTNNKWGMSMDAFQELTSCLTNRYQWVESQSSKEQNNLEQLSSIGLYSDGDTSNSDYDIIADIDKINAIIFSTPEKYTGVKNNAKDALSKFLSNKKIPTIFDQNKAPIISANNNGGGNNSDASNIDTNSTQTQNSQTLVDLIGGSCVWTSNSPIAVSDLNDENFQKELANALGTNPTQKNTNTISNGWYTKPVGWIENTNTIIPKTSKGDFFDKLPCNGIFCVDVKIKMGSQNLLAGGKNYSIEWILDKNADILTPIADSSLRSEKMTNNFWSLPFANMKLSNLVAGGKIYLAGRPQPTRVTPVAWSEEKEFSDAEICAYLTAGLSTDPIQANGFWWGGYNQPWAGITTDNINIKQSPSGSQDTNTNAANCMQLQKDAGREKSYASFSDNLTQIQAFTDGFVNEINEIVLISQKLHTLPVK